MDHVNSNNFDGQLPEDTILHLNRHLTKKGKSLLLTLYKYQRMQHKELAKMLDIQSNGLTNLLKRIKQINKDLIICKSEGRNKLYSLAQIAKIYTENELLPKETAQQRFFTSFLHADPSIQDVLKSLSKFQESEGNNWYIVLDDFLLAESKNKDKIKDGHDTNIEGAAYQNYINFINAMIDLIIRYGQQAAHKVYDVLEEKILIHRLESLLSNLLDDYYQIEPLFRKEKENLQDAYSIIDMIFSKRYPAIFGIYPKPLPEEYYRVDRAISIMINEFEENNYNKNVSITQWEKKFYTKAHFSCISYIAEKCSIVYIGKEKLFS